MEKRMKILDLPLKKEWYDMIESGVKTEEYREIKPYWCNRLLYGCSLGIDEYWRPVLEKTFKTIEKLGERMPKSFNLEHLLVWQYGIRAYTHVRFRYGYTKRTMLFELKDITIGKGNTEWGAPEDKEVFILKLGNRIV
jgi:hypothetical protein